MKVQTGVKNILINLVKSVNPWHFLWLSVILSELFTALVNTIQSYLRWGYVSSDLLLIGTIDALFVPLAVAPIIMIFLFRLNRLQQDILIQKEEEKALANSEALFRMLVESSPVAMAVLRGTLEKVEYVNRRFTELFGYSIEDMPDAGHWWPLAYPDEEYRKEVFDEWNRRLKETFSNKSRFEPMETIVTCRDGSRIAVEFALASINGTNVLFGMDRTARQKMEEALRESEEKMRVLAETAGDAIVMIDNNGNITYWNPAAEGIFGYPGREVMGKDLHLLLVPRCNHDEYRRGFADFRHTGRGWTVGKTLELAAIRKTAQSFLSNYPFQPS